MRPFLLFRQTNVGMRINILRVNDDRKQPAGRALIVPLHPKAEFPATIQIGDTVGHMDRLFGLDI